MVQSWVLETLFHKRFLDFYLFKPVKEELWRLYIKMFRKHGSVSLDLDTYKIETKFKIKSGYFTIGVVFQASWYFLSNKHM